VLHSERYGCVASYSGEPAGVVATSATAQTLLHIARNEKSGPKAAPLDLSRCWGWFKRRDLGAHGCDHEHNLAIEE